METTTRRWPAVMVDLETLGTTAKAAVIEIGAVCFDLERLELGPTFERKICLLANERSGRLIEAETLDWWMGRWRESGRVPRLLDGDTVEGAYWAFLEFWADHAAEKVEFWSRGSFDEVILRDIGEALGTPPWKFWSVRDQRTVCAWAGVPKAADVAHSALEDATDQVLALFQARTGIPMREEELR